jgi:hypothetical protein
MRYLRIIDKKKIIMIAVYSNYVLLLHGINKFYTRRWEKTDERMKLELVIKIRLSRTHLASVYTAHEAFSRNHQSKEIPLFRHFLWKNI